MTTAERNPVVQLLDGMVRCQNCGAPMENTGAFSWETPMYVCPRRQGGCGSPGVPAEPLATLVVEAVIRTALEHGNAQQVVEAVQEDAQQRIREYNDARNILETRPAPRTAMEVVNPPPPDLSGLDPEMRRLVQLDEAQYIEPLRRLDRYWSASGDTGHIAGYALDPDTYLRLSNLATTRAILENAVAEVQVGPASATIRYRTAMPPDSGTSGKSQEEVSLPGS